MRVELAAIHGAQDKYKNEPWIGIFTYSQTNLAAIQHKLQRPSHAIYKHYKPFIATIVSTLRYMIRLGLPIILHKRRGHTPIRGNDLAGIEAKRIVTSFEDIPGHQKLTSIIGKHVERPAFWVMYTSKPPTPSISLATGPHAARLRPPWWTIPENERLCMHVFAKPSNQLCIKIRSATLLFLHPTSLYRRLVANAQAQVA